MSLIPDRYPCTDCDGYTGHVGAQQRRDPSRVHLACSCPEPESFPALTAAEMAPIELRFRERGGFFL